MPQTRLPSEVTGTVWKIEVREGDAVTEEQTLLVLESMKMEIPVTAPRAGTTRAASTSIRSASASVA